MSETADNPDAEVLQPPEQPPVARDPSTPEVPADHPLSYLGGEYRVLAGYIADLEARLKKLEGG